MATATRTTRNLWLLLQGQFVTNMGNQIYDIAMLLWIKEVTGSASLMGLALLLTNLPHALLGPLGGKLADRFGSVQPLVLFGRADEGHRNAPQERSDQPAAVERLGRGKAEQRQRRDHADADPAVADVGRSGPLSQEEAARAATRDDTARPMRSGTPFIGAPSQLVLRWVVALA